jgi:FkbM family methyltransferase
MSVKNDIEKLCNIEKMEQHDPSLFKGMILNEYEQVGFKRSDVIGKDVIDLGANVGMFCALCHAVGAKSIFAIEFNPENFVMLQENMSRMNVSCLRRAAFDGVKRKVQVSGSGVTSKIGESGPSVEALSLDDILVASGFHGDDLVLKVDVEGAEYDILLAASGRTIRKFKTIYLETHIPDRKELGRNSKFLIDYLSFFGFTVREKTQMCHWEWDGKGNCTKCTEIENFSMMSLDRN